MSEPISKDDQFICGRCNARSPWRDSYYQDHTPESWNQPLSRAGFGGPGTWDFKNHYRAFCPNCGGLIGDETPRGFEWMGGARSDPEGRQPAKGGGEWVMAIEAFLPFLVPQGADTLDVTGFKYAKTALHAKESDFTNWLKSASAVDLIDRLRGREYELSITRELISRGCAAVPHLIVALGDPQWYVRRCACLVLRDMGEPAREARDALTRALSDSAEVVRLLAQDALERLSRESPPVPRTMRPTGETAQAKANMIVTSIAPSVAGTTGPSPTLSDGSDRPRMGATSTLSALFSVVRCRWRGELPAVLYIVVGMSLTLAAVSFVIDKKPFLPALRLSSTILLLMSPVILVLLAYWADKGQRFFGPGSAEQKARTGSEMGLVAGLMDVDERVRASTIEALASHPTDAAVAPLLLAARAESMPTHLLDNAIRACARERSVPALSEGLGDTNPRVRRVAVKGLVAAASEQSSAALLGALHDSDDGVYEPAARELTERGYAPARAALVTMLTDGSDSKRAVAAELLADLSGPDVRDALARALLDDSYEVGERAAASLKVQKWTPTTLEQRAWYAVARHSWATAAGLGSVAVPALIRAIEAQVEGMPEALRALGRIRDERTFDLLVKCTDSRDWDVCAAAAQALGELGDHRAGVVLGPLVRNANCYPERDRAPARRLPADREPTWPNHAALAAANALIKLRHPRAVTILVEECEQGGAHAVGPLHRIVREYGRELPLEDLERIINMPPVHLYEQRHSGGDPEGGISPYEAVPVGLACGDLRASVREEIARRGSL